MDNWVDCLLDEKAMKGVFNDDAPSLAGVDLHEIVLHRDGPKVSVRFDLSQYPSHPPKKWEEMGFNKVQIVIDAFDVKELNISGWKSRLVMDMEISNEGGAVSFRAKGGEASFYILASFVTLSSISAYKDNGE